MSTGYSWEGIRQVRATLLGARRVPERLCGGRVYLGRYIKCSTSSFTFNHSLPRVTKHKRFDKPNQLIDCHWSIQQRPASSKTTA